MYDFPDAPTIILVRVSVGLSFHDESSMVEAKVVLGVCALRFTIPSPISERWNCRWGKGEPKLQKLHGVGKFFNGFRPDPPLTPTPQKKKYQTEKGNRTKKNNKLKLN